MSGISAKGRNCDPSNNEPTNTPVLTRQRKRAATRKVAREDVNTALKSKTNSKLVYNQDVTRKTTRQKAIELAKSLR